MAKAAVGLFKGSDAANGIVRDLEASGISPNDIRIVIEAREIPGSGMMSTAHSDFEANLIRELRSLGATDPEAEAYVWQVRHGGMIIFVVTPATRPLRRLPAGRPRRRLRS